MNSPSVFECFLTWLQRLHVRKALFTRLYSHEREYIAEQTYLQNLEATGSLRCRLFASSFGFMPDPKIYGLILNQTGNFQSRHVHQHEVKLPFPSISKPSSCYSHVFRDDDLNSSFMDNCTPRRHLWPFFRYSIPSKCLGKGERGYKNPNDAKDSCHYAQWRSSPWASYACHSICTLQIRWSCWFRWCLVKVNLWRNCCTFIGKFVQRLILMES